MWGGGNGSPGGIERWRNTVEMKRRCRGNTLGAHTSTHAAETDGLCVCEENLLPVITLSLSLAPRAASLCTSWLLQPITQATTSHRLTHGPETTSACNPAITYTCTCVSACPSANFLCSPVAAGLVVTPKRGPCSAGCQCLSCLIQIISLWRSFQVSSHLSKAGHVLFNWRFQLPAPSASTTSPFNSFDIKTTWYIYLTQPAFNLSLPALIIKDHTHLIMFIKHSK